MSLFTPASPIWTSRLLAVLRIVAAIIIIMAGSTKAFGFPPPPAVIPPMPVIPAMWEIHLAAWLELIGGTALVLGFLTRPVAFLLSGEMAVAYWQFQNPVSPWITANGGMPTALLCFHLPLYLVRGRRRLDHRRPDRPLDCRLRPLTDVAAPTPRSVPAEKLPPAAPTARKYDRSIIEGPTRPRRVEARVANDARRTSSAGCRGSSTTSWSVTSSASGATRRIGVAYQIFIMVIVFISSVFTGMSVLVARFAGAGDEEKVDRTVYQAFLTAIGISLFVLAPIGYLRRADTARPGERRAGGEGAGAAVPAHHVHLQHRNADVLHVERCAAIGW